MKKIKTKIKLQIPSGSANPAPPVGPALGQYGVAIMDFCNAFNEKTKNMEKTILPVVVTVYEDRSFDFIIKNPPASSLLKKALALEKGSAIPGKEKVAKITRSQLREIAGKDQFCGEYPKEYKGRG